MERTMPRKMSVVEQWEKYWSKVRKTDGCWIWTGSTNSGGYGNHMIQGRLCGAHRLMLYWMGKLKHPIHAGSRADGLVLHSCDNPLCVNPEHLSVGTNTQNQKEAYSRGLRRQPNGPNHANSKLTQEQADEIRRLYGSGEMLQIPLAKKYGVSQRVISLIVRRETYK